jgi:hypothetical protein
LVALIKDYARRATCNFQNWQSTRAISNGGDEKFFPDYFDSFKGFVEKFSFPVVGFIKNLGV